MNKRRSFPWPSTGLIWLAPLALMAPAWLTGRAIFWGTPFLQFVPWLAWAAQTLARGHLPLWNPLVGMGAPLLANYQSALLYPPNWLLLVLGALGGAPLLAWGQALVIALHLGWAGIGMAKLAQRLGLGKLAGMVSGLAFSLSGYLVARSAFLSINAAAAWLPWVMLGVLEVAFPSAHPKDAYPSRRGRLPTLLTFALGMQLLAGHAQTAWYTLLLAGFWAVFWGFQAYQKTLADHSDQNKRVNLLKSMKEKVTHLRERTRPLLYPLVMLALASLIAAGMAAAQLLPTAEYLLNSQRESGLDLDFALAYSFSPWHFLTLTMPDFFGNPGRGEFSGYANYWESAVYIGLLPFLLSLGAIISALRKKVGPEARAVILFLAVVTLVSFALALGKNTPLYPWLYQNVPTFDMFLGPSRWTLWAVFALALLAGYGVQEWRRPQGRGLYWTRLGTAGAFAAIGGALLAGKFSTQVQPAQAAAVAMAGVWAAAAGFLSLSAPHADAHPRTPWAWGVVLLVCVDLMVTHLPINPTIELDLYRSPSPASGEIRERLEGSRLYLSKDDEYAIKFERFFRFRTYDPGEDWYNLRQVYLPNSNVLDGLPSANNFDPLVPARYARWMDYLEKASPDELDRLLSRMSIGLIERVSETEPHGVSFEKVNHLDRLRWAPCAIIVQSPEEAWEQITGQSSMPHSAQAYVVLEGISSLQKPACNPQETAQTWIVAENPNTLEIAVVSSSPGWLVIADIWYPGWTARVDGIPTPVLQADYLFRAVAVPRGEHRIHLRYLPVPFYLGICLSLCAWGGLGFALFRGAKRSVHQTCDS